MDRREFLNSSLAAGAALASLGSAGADSKKTLRAGLIGCGWYGMVDLRHLMALNQAEVVALCDVDRHFLQASADEVAQNQKERPQTFSDFREMLKPRNLDLVLVGTPDHWHALTAIAALEAGADVYVQKPIAHTYLEGRAILNTARKHNRVVQVGTQRRSTPHIEKAREFIKEGKLGHIGQVRAYCYYNMRGNENPPDGTPPEHFDYEMWTGPAPLRPYNRLVHPRTWRKFEEYSNGILGDMGIHMLDVMRWVLGVRYPQRITSTGGIFVQKGGKPNITDTQTVTYDFGDLTAVWEHRTYGRADDPKWGWGVNFYGEKGTVLISVDRWEFQPWGSGAGKPIRQEAVRMKLPDPKKLESEVIAPAGRAHMKNFIDCVQTRSRPVADIEEGHISTALCVLGTVSQKLGRTLKWDAEKERVVGDEEANKLLRREYRKPWVYPEA